MRLLSVAFLGALVISDLAAASGETPSSTPEALAAAAVVGAPHGVPLSGSALEAEARRVGTLLRCPVCQGVSIADSPAEMAVDMLGQVREMLAAGYTEQQVIAYFEGSYGEFVRLKPALRGVNWVLWLAPILGLFVGGAIVVAFLRRSRGTDPAVAVQTPAAAPQVTTEPEDPRLAEYVRRVRALADTGRSQEPRKP